MVAHQKRSKASQLNQNINGNNHMNLEAWRVLIVDDVSDNITVVEALLAFHDANVCTAHDGQEGLQQVATFKPTLILLDLSMPDMDGWEMKRHLSQNPETANIPVIALTAHAMQGDRERVMEAGFSGYIAKPFSVTTLIGDIQHIIRNANTSGEGN